MPAPASYARRQFPGAAVDTTISAGINNSVTSCSLTATTGWPTGAYTGGVLCELYSVTTGATAEKVWATDLTGSTLTIVRAADGSSAATHAAGTGIRPVAGAIDADEANRAVNETIGQVTTAGDMLVADGAASMTRLAIGAAGRIPVSSGTAPVWRALSGDATLDASGALSIAADAVGSDELAAAYKPRWSVGGFLMLASTAGTATQMYRPTLGASDISGGQIPYLAPEAGAIVGLSVVGTAARSAGSMTFEVYKNGSGTGFTAVIDGSNTQYVYATQAETADTFAAGDRIDVRATNASFTSSATRHEAHVLLQAV